ncbi:MAG: GNAT family N-acetyltransferase [Bacteroidales bacterium]|nr:GNAT family N-acetyltransferase [Bacteroidales bacterium]
MKPFTICAATQEHLPYVDAVVQALEDASRAKGTGLAKRSPEYIRSKIEQGKAVIALYKDSLAGFCYIESWEHERYVATSGLIVCPEYRSHGLATAIKKEAFHLARRKFPAAKMFGLTTSLAVMRINSSLGFVPVTFTELTADQEFWKGCETCQYYDVLQRSGNKNCLCTGMLFDPSPKVKVWKRKKSSSLSLVDLTRPTL